MADKEINSPADSKRRNSKTKQSDIEGEDETLVINASSGSPIGRRELAKQLLVYDRNTMRNSLEQQPPTS